MNMLTKPVLAAGLAIAALTAPAVTSPAMAQAAQKIAIVNIPAVVRSSTAYQTAQTQRQTTYAAQLQQAETRSTALQTQLSPLADAFNAARQAPNPDQASLQAQIQQLQQLQQQGEAEINQILQPLALSEAYVTEQIEDQLGQALENAAQAAGVTLVLSPDTVVFADNSHNLNEAVLAQLNVLIPAAQLVPPQGWLPREQRQQQAAAAAQQQQRQAAAGAAQPAISGR